MRACAAVLLGVVALVPGGASAQEVWRGDFETDDTSQFDGELNGSAGGADRITIVGSPVAEGAHAARIELVNEARWPNGLKRVELHHSPAPARTADGEELYFAWSLFLPETLPSDPDQQIGYWETDASYSQLMAFTLIGSDLRFSTNHPAWQEHWRGAGVVTPGVWHRIAMHVVWSRDASVGRVDVWFDGAQVVTGATAATLVDGNPAFVQLGLLRGAIEFSDSPVILLDDVVEGDSLASVRPEGAASSADAGVLEDAGAILDGGAPLDASIGPDSGVAPRDAGETMDAGASTLTGSCACRGAPGTSPRAAGIVLVAALAWLGAASRRRVRHARRAATARVGWLGCALAVPLLALAGSAAAQPAHCERALERQAWPAPGEPIETTEVAPVTAAEARRALAAFRRAWRTLPHPGPVLRSFTECMDASAEHFVVRRVSAAYARRAVEQLASGSFATLVLAGSASALPAEGWVWEVYWGGASRRHPPSGPVSLYFAPDLRTLHAAVQWPEG